MLCLNQCVHKNVIFQNIPILTSNVLMYHFIKMFASYMTSPPPHPNTNNSISKDLGWMADFPQAVPFSWSISSIKDKLFQAAPFVQTSNIYMSEKNNLYLRRIFIQQYEHGIKDRNIVPLELLVLVFHPNFWPCWSKTTDIKGCNQFQYSTLHCFGID